MLMLQQAATVWSSPAGDLARDQTRAQAKTLLQQGDHEGAYSLYMRLLREDPADDEINFGLALSARGAKRNSQALLAFERLTDRYPADANLRRFLADIYLRLGDRDAALRELHIAREFDPTLTDKNINDILERLESVQSRFQIHGRVGAGAMYDTNANQGPASERFNFDLLPGTVSIAGVKNIPSWGAYLNGMLDAGYRLGDDSPWWLVSDVAFFKRWNENNELTTANEFAWARAAVGFRHLSSNTMTELRFKMEAVDQSLEQRVRVGGPEFTFLWAVLPNLQLITRASLEQRTYSLDLGRDGTYWSLGEYLRILLGDSGHELTFGLRGMGTDIDVSDYNYNGLEASARLRLKITEKLAISPFASVRRERYYGPPSVLDISARTDITHRSGVFVTYALSNNLQLETSAQFVRNNSSSPLYRYQQNSYSMGLAWSF